MFSPLWNYDPFYNDVLPSPMLRLMGPTSNNNNNLNNPTNLMPYNSNLPHRLRNLNNPNTQHQWLHWNDLMDDPLQLSLQDTENGYELITRSPQGLRKKDIHIEVQDNVLTLQGQREKRKTGRGNEEQYERISFSRSMVLPPDVNLDKINARYDDKQTLHVELPRKAGAGPRAIEIQGLHKLEQKDQPLLGNKQEFESSTKSDKERSSGSQSFDKSSSEPRSQNQQIPISRGTK